MKDKKAIEVCLRSFRHGDVSFEYAVDFILSVYKDSKRFNFNSFYYGAFAGVVIMAIVLEFLV